MQNDFRQKFHLEPEKGWLNDPNGLSFFNGKYHVYFQYSPDSAYGKGDKCWGHWESEDLINWNYTGIVLRPDSPKDRSGAYSGCGLVVGDTLHIFYTGNVKKDGDYDYITSGREANVIHVTTKDGCNMSEKQMLLTNSDYPDYCSCHVRDPKVWEEDGIYYMVLGARTLDGKGCVLYYSSCDLVNWIFEKQESKDNFGYMWECPDVINISGKKYLSFSPQGLEHKKCSHQNVYSSGYLNGDKFIEWDYGFDFYAPQTFKDGKGRTLLTGWMGIGDIPYKNPTAEMGWQHCLTVMRELTLGEDGEIYQTPVSELEGLRGEEKNISGGEFEAELPFELIGRADKDFLLDSDLFMLVFSDNILTLKFKDMKASGGRDERNAELDDLQNIRILADKSSLEIYINSGKRVMSSRFYPEDINLKFSIRGFEGKVFKLRNNK